MIQNPDELFIMCERVHSYWWTEKFDKALEMSERMIRCAPTNSIGYELKGSSLKFFGRINDSVASFDKCLKYTTEKTEAQRLIIVSKSNALLLAGDWEKALSDAEKALQIGIGDHTALINKCIALNKLGRAEEADSILRENLPIIKDEYLRACAFAVLSDKENMLKELAVAIEGDSRNRVTAKFDPDFTDYRDDLDFRKLVYEAKE